jgi:predicted MFS family arabinose efflux permease
VQHTDKNHEHLKAGADRSPNWLVLGTLIGLTASIAPTIFYSFGLFLIPMSSDLGWSRSMLSGALLVITVVTIFSAPTTGRLIDRFGMTRVVAPAIILFATAIASLAVVRTPMAYFLAFGVMGVVGVAHSPLAYSREIARRFTAHRGKALGIAMAGIGIGGAYMPALAQRAIDSAGWRSAFLTMGAMVLVVGTVGLLVFQVGLSRSTRPRSGPVSAAIGWRTLAKEARFRRLLLAFFLIGFAVNGAMSHLGAILDGSGVDAVSAAMMQSATGISMIVGRVGCGILLDKLAPQRVAIAFVVTPLAGLLMLVSLHGHDMVLPACVLLGLGLGAEADLLSFFTARFFPADSFSEVSGYFFSSFTLGVGLGSVALASSYDLFRSYAPGLLFFSLVLAVLCFLLRDLGNDVRPAGTANHPA